MPKFCWAQFHVPGATTDEFKIHCGVASNHYCYALMYIIRAKQPGLSKQGRWDLLGHAEVDILYTERGTKDVQSCSIREHLAGTKVEVRNLRAMYGLKPSDVR